MKATSLWPNAVAKIAGVCVFIAGVVVLMGWCFDVSALKSILPDWPKMSPLTAVSFVLGGFSLWCTVSATQRKMDLSRVSQICAAIIVFVALFRLSDYLFRWNLNFDTLGFHAPTGIVSPARMSRATALNFLLLGGALLLAGGSRLIRTFQFLTLSAVLLSWLGFCHFFFGDAPMPFFTAMAMPTAICFLLLGAGIFCARTDGGLMALLVSDSGGGLLARRLLPSALFVLFAINWLESWIDRHNWFSSGAESALFMLNDIIIFGALVWFNAALLHRADMKRGRAEEARTQLAGIVESSDDAIIGKTLDGIITSWNRGAEKIFGYSAQEAIGQPMLMLFPPERVNEERDILARVARGENIENFETVRIRKDKKQIHVSTTISPLKDSSGKIIGASKIARDITARRKLEEQLRQSQKMEGIGQLAGGVAHDFNNILAVIQMQSELLKSSGGLSAEQSEFADEIGVTVQRAAALTRQLLLFSRREVFQPRDLDLSESVTSTTKMLRRILGENIQVQLKLASQPMFIHADAGMMDQVLLNLAVNARDAMPNGGQLVIETSGVEFDEFAVTQSPQARPGSFVRLNVSDSGCGISPEILPKIFEPFFTTKDVGKGTGLGLATVFGIVQQHQGWINVYSEVNHGTTFRVYLPRLAKNAGQKSSQPALTTTSGGNETILLAEDDLSLRVSVRKALWQLGYRILEAPTGVKALEVWKENRDEIRLLLTDLVMPDGMSGKDLAQRILQENPKLKVIYMSGYSAETVGKDFPLKEGVNFLTKPFQASKLAQTIRNNLDSR
ncbi:MAG TPA: PAS domain S-box protein [Verrucomicrobiae bacterium]|jgi:PAS domain S-box-containing protein